MIGRPLPRVLIVGGGELGSAVSHRLARSGMTVFVVDLDRPKCIRRHVCFAMALLEGSKIVEGVRAERASSYEEALRVSRPGVIPVLAGDFKAAAAALRPDAIVDARMLKRGQDISMDLAPLVIGLGPGFIAGCDVHVAIETNRGHNLGRLFYSGSAEPPTGVPGEVCGFSGERVIRSPGSGVFRASAELGKMVEKGCPVGTVDGRLDVKAQISGLLRGLISDGAEVIVGEKIGDVDPRGADVDSFTISDKGRAVGGGVLEAIMHWWTA